MILGFLVLPATTGGIAESFYSSSIFFLFYIENSANFCLAKSSSLHFLTIELPLQHSDCANHTSLYLCAVWDSSLLNLDDENCQQ